jgi:hypothetical protein
MRDVVGHLDEQRIALPRKRAAFDHLAVERDLDVDLVVRTIDAGRIVDEVGVDPPAMAGEGDARRLGDAKIRALADRPRAEILGIDAQPVIGRIADLDMVLARAFT